MGLTRSRKFQIGILPLLMALPLAAGVADDKKPEKKDPPSIIGRWDLVMRSPQGEFPSWLEVRLSGRSTLVGSFVGRFGSSRPISQIDFSEGELSFAIPPQWERRKDNQRFRGRLDGETLRGETTDEKGQHVSWIGRRAPALKRAQQPKWGAAAELFNGKDLTGWKARSAATKNGWLVKNGHLVNSSPGNDLVTDEKFTDFRLRAEFRYPQGSNSGIYLRGRYEVQIEDNFGDEPDSLKIGGIYGFLTPSINASKKAGEWQSLEVVLVGRVVTVMLNGGRIIDRQTIPGITGGALDSDEGAPGPIMLQGDHGPIEFRRLTVGREVSDER